MSTPESFPVKFAFPLDLPFLYPIFFFLLLSPYSVFFLLLLAVNVIVSCST